MDVSIVLAAFRSPWIREAIKSVQAQTRSGWELLVIDDANSADVARLIEELADPRIRYVANKLPLGPALNHRSGVDLATHDLVVFINHDDAWEPELLDRLVPPLEADQDVVVAFADHWVIGADGKIDRDATDAMSARWGRDQLAPGVHRPFGELAVVSQAIPVAQCAVWRKDAIPPIPGWAADRYDYWIQVTLAATGGGAVYVPERLARFRIHDSNLGGDPGLRRRLEGLVFYHRLLQSSDLGAQAGHVRRRRREAVVRVAKWPVAWTRSLVAG